MNTDIKALTHKLMVYKERLYDLHHVHGWDSDAWSQIVWYENQIDEMESELAVAHLVIEMHIGPVKPHKVVTDSLLLVKSIFIEEEVISLKHKFNLRYMKWFWHVEFNYKTR